VKVFTFKIDSIFEELGMGGALQGAARVPVLSILLYKIV